MGDNEQVEHRKEGTNSGMKNEVPLEGRQTIFVTHQINIPLFSGEEFNERGEPEMSVEAWCDLVEDHMNRWNIQNPIKRILEARSLIKKNSPAYYHFVYMNRWSAEETWDELKKKLIGYYSLKNEHPLDIAQRAFKINWAPGDEVISYYYNLTFTFESFVSVLNELTSSEENKIPDCFIKHLATVFIYNKLNNAHRRIFRKLWKIDMTSIEIILAFKRVLMKLESDKHRNTSYCNGKKENESNEAKNSYGKYNPKGNSNLKKQYNYEFINQREKQQWNSQNNHQPKGSSKTLERTFLPYKFCLRCERVSHHTNQCNTKFVYCGKCRMKGHQRGQMERCKGSRWNHKKTYDKEMESKGAKPKYNRFTQEDKEESSEDERWESFSDEYDYI